MPDRGGSALKPPRVIGRPLGGAFAIHSGLNPVIEGGVLFSGFAALLIENVFRTVRAARTRRKALYE